MKLSQMLCLLVVLGFGLGFTLPAHAINNPVIDFSPGYACEGTRAVDDHTSTPGDALVIVGHVALFQDPFDALDANDPAVEYTYVYDQLTSAGTVDVGGFGFFFDTDYTGGRLRVFCDDTPDADFSDKSSFEDGTLILQADLTNFRTHTENISNPCAGNMNADITAYSGGTMAHLLNGCSGAITGAFGVCSAIVPGAQQAQGYFGNADSKIDADCPVPLEESTWGGIKKLYQD